MTSEYRQKPIRKLTMQFCAGRLSVLVQWRLMVGCLAIREALLKVISPKHQLTLWLQGDRKNDQRQQIKWKTESLVEDIPSKLCSKNPQSQQFANLASNSFMNIFGSEMTMLLVRTLCYYLHINFSFLLYPKIVVSNKRSPWRKKTWYPLFQTMTDLPP